MVSHEYGRPEYADCPFGDGTEVDGTGGGWGQPRSDYLRSDALLRDLNEQQIDKPLSAIMFNFGQTPPVKARRVVPDGREQCRRSYGHPEKR